MNEKIIKELIKAIEILNKNIEENKKGIEEIKELITVKKTRKVVENGNGNDK